MKRDLLVMLVSALLGGALVYMSLKVGYAVGEQSCMQCSKTCFPEIWRGIDG